MDDECADLVATVSAIKGLKVAEMKERCRARGVKGCSAGGIVKNGIADLLIAEVRRSCAVAEVGADREALGPVPNSEGGIVWPSDDVGRDADGDADGGGPGAEDESFGVTDAADVVLT